MWIRNRTAQKNLNRTSSRTVKLKPYSVPFRENDRPAKLLAEKYIIFANFRNNLTGEKHK